VVSQVDKRRFFLSAKVANTATSQDCWWLTVVYGPQADQEKVEFLDEFRQFRMTADGPWVLCGDFNMIYREEDKSNDRLNRRCMRRFRAFIDAAELEELHLVGRQFTWSSERDQPTLERLDRVFATTGWLQAHPNHVLRALSTDCSDHCPLLLMAKVVPWAKKRFRFEPHWIKFPGFMEVVESA